jgi:hypothetical protein
MSSHGEIELIGSPRSVRSSSSIPTIICIHVVPHFDGVEMITSSGLNSKRSHRALSAMKPRYRRMRAIRSAAPTHPGRPFGRASSTLGLPTSLLLPIGNELVGGA